ncbi:hypothetical protein P9112_007393 [Eukaryota sp. TZLM1-RC]
MVSLVSTVLNATLPSVMTMAIGLLAIKAKSMKHSSVNSINSFIFRFCIPSLLFRLMSSLDISTVEVEFIYALITFKFISFTITLIICLIMRHAGFETPLHASIYAIWVAFAWTNSVILGIPIGSALFGEQAAQYSVICGTLNQLTHIPTSIILLLSGQTEKHGIEIKKYKIISKKVFTNNSIIAVILGLIFTFLPLSIPEVIDTCLSYLANVTVGGSLFCIGMFLAVRMNELKEGKEKVITELQDVVHHNLEEAEIEETESDVDNNIITENDDVILITGNDVSVATSKDEEVERSEEETIVEGETMGGSEGIDGGEEDIVIELSDSGSDKGLLSKANVISSVQEKSTDSVNVYDPNSFSFVLLLFLLRFFVAPFLISFVTRFFNMTPVGRNILVFIYTLPSALSVFTLSKEYGVAATALNKLLLFGNCLLPFILFFYSFVFGFVE